MWDIIVEFFTVPSYWELLIILISKIIEVSIGTLRQILVNKGYRKQGTILAFFEIILWVFIASRVINGITEAPLKGVIYSLGYAIGVFVGSKIENYLAFGKILLQTITTEALGIVMVEALRSQGYGVTTVKAQGKDTNRSVLMLFANRKGKETIIGKIREIDSDAMIITNDVSTLQGGYISSWKRLGK